MVDRVHIQHKYSSIQPDSSLSLYLLKMGVVMSMKSVNLAGVCSNSFFKTEER